MQQKTLSTYLMMLTSCTLAMSLTACGGDSGSTTTTASSSSNSSSTTLTTTGFSTSVDWVIDSTNVGTVCYDFDLQAEVNCTTSNTWDIKFDNQARSVKLWSNSGTSGTGKGGVFGLIDWQDLKQFTNATQDPLSQRNIAHHYQADSSATIFSNKPWYEYNIQGTHQLFPNNRVYLITTDNTNSATASSVQMPIYALQVINYYKGSTSGYPTLRWIDTALPEQVLTKQFDASSTATWTYINLATGETTTSDGDWHIALQRMNIKLNGGVSGTAKVGGFLAKTPAGYYDSEGNAIEAKFTSDNSEATLTDLKDVANYTLPSGRNTWVIDTAGSLLNPAYTGTYPSLDYGWYTYDGTTHKLSAKPEATAKGALVRSAEGNSYARIRLTDIQYNNVNAPTTATNWIFKLDIQPAS